MAVWLFVAFLYAYGWCSWRSRFLLVLCMHNGAIAPGGVTLSLLGYMHMKHSIAFGR
jgi:hypothetical protein